MNQDFSILTLVTQASLVVQLVMAGLMLASLASWTVIFGKLFGLRKIRSANDEFEREFWAGKNLNDLYADAGRAQMTIAQQAWRVPTVQGGTEELLAEGTIRIGCVDAGTFKPQRIPSSIAESFSSTTQNRPG